MKLVKGAAELISFVLVIAILLAGIGAVLFIGNPIVDRSRDAATISEARSILTTIDSVVREVIYERSGSTRVVPITVTNGEFTVDDNDDYIEFFIETEDRFVEPTSQVKNGNIFESSRRDVRAYTGTVSGTDALILENSHTWFAIRWVNETTPLASYNTSNMTLLFGNKDGSYNETFSDSSIFIDELPNTNTGTGWSELVHEDTLFGVGEAVVHFHSDEGTNYTITFRLRSDADYVTMEVTDVTGSPSNVTAAASFVIESTTEDTRSDNNNYVVADNGTFVMSLLDDGTPLDTSVGTVGSDNQLNLTQAEDGNEFYYILTEGTNSTVGDADLDEINDFSGAFSYSFSHEDNYYSWLYYQDTVDIVSNLTFGKGSHELILKNEGVSNSKVQLNITLK